MMEIKFTGPAFAVAAEMKEFIAAWEESATGNPVSPNTPDNGVTTTVTRPVEMVEPSAAEPAKKRGRPPKKQLEQQHEPTVAALPETEPTFTAEKLQALAEQEFEVQVGPAPAAEPEPLPVPDIETLKTLFREYAQKKGVKACTELLAEFGINKVSDLGDNAADKIAFFERVTA